jgi:TetR/AcrR family transcriptional regulator, regulator of cefoperazone and chloramphenicol sensitivity
LFEFVKTRVAMKRQPTKIKATALDKLPTGCRERLLMTAEKLFAQRGLASVSIRDLVGDAEANIAAVNYHFGGKDNLYLETLRYSFRNLAQSLPNLVALQTEAKAVGTVEAAERAIRLFIEELMKIIFVSGKNSQRADLLRQELSNPTEALDVIVEEFCAPLFKILVALVEQVRPDLAANKESHLVAMSITGQCLNYSLALPLTLKLLKQSKMTPGLVQKLSKQISDFSLRALSKGAG